jgi:hypothetical protein
VLAVPSEAKSVEFPRSNSEPILNLFDQEGGGRAGDIGGAGAAAETRGEVEAEPSATTVKRFGSEEGLTKEDEEYITEDDVVGDMAVSHAETEAALSMLMSGLWSGSSLPSATSRLTTNNFYRYCITRLTFTPTRYPQARPSGGGCRPTRRIRQH